MVDAGDLKSPGILYCTGSSPVCGTHKCETKRRKFLSLLVFVILFERGTTVFFCVIVVDKFLR